MIPEVHDMVAAGYQRYVGTLSVAVSVFLQFSGFQYDRDLNLQRLNQFLRTVLETTHEYGGRLNRLSMGDKGSTMLLLFGTPAALEKKEQTACQWAVEVRNAVRDSFPELQLRLGMTSGRVFSGIVGGAGRFEFTVMGDCVNLAARLMQGARPDEICADASMQEKAWEAFEFDSPARCGSRASRNRWRCSPCGSQKPPDASGFGGVWKDRGSQRRVEVDRTGASRQSLHDRAGRRAGRGEVCAGGELLMLAAQDWKIVTGRGDITRRGFTYNPWRDPYVALVFDGRVPVLERSLLF